MNICISIGHGESAKLYCTMYRLCWKARISRKYKKVNMR